MLSESKLKDQGVLLAPEVTHLGKNERTKTGFIICPFKLLGVRVLFCVQLFAIPWIVGQPVSSVHGIFQAGILERIAFSPPRNLPKIGIEPVSPALAGRFCTTEPPGKSKVLGMNL